MTHAPPMRIQTVLLYDTADDATWLRNLDRPHTAVLAVRPNRRSRRLAWLANDLLEAVGVSSDVSGAGRNASDDWELVALHYHQHQIRTLLVLEAHDLDNYLTGKLLELAATLDLQVILVAHPSRRGELPDLLDAWPHERLDRDQFRATWLTPDPTKHPATEQEEGTSAGDVDVRVPTSDFPTFRADCRRLLEEDAVEAVDHRYLETLEQARTWADTEHDILAVREHDAAEDVVALWLRDRFDDCATADQMLTVVRATQVALFEAGIYLQVDIDAFLGANHRVHTAATRSPETWRRIAAYRQPYRQAACALAAANLSLDQMHQLTLTDLNDDASTITVDDRTVTVEPDARPCLQLLALERQIHGATDNSPLFADENGEPLSDRQLTLAVTDPLTECGVALVNGQVVRRTQQPNRWTRRQGISIQHLTEEAA